MAKYSKAVIHDALIKAQAEGKGIRQVARELNMSEGGVYYHARTFGIRLTRDDARHDVDGSATDERTRRAINYLYNQGYVIKRRTGTDLAHFLSTRALRAVKSG